MGGKQSSSIEIEDWKVNNSYFVPAGTEIHINQQIATPEIQNIRNKLKLMGSLECYSRQEIDKFIDFQALLNTGEHGQIYQTKNANDMRILKSIQFSMSNSKQEIEKLVKEFYNEIFVQAQLRGQKNLMTITGICEDQMLGLIEVRQIQNLSNIFQTGLSMEEKNRIANGIINGIYNLHTFEKKIIHGDLKPDNILLDAQLNPLISDFGKSYQVYKTGMYQKTSGTIQYMAPEIVTDEVDFTTKQDIWSLGCVLNELYSEKKPFQNSTPQQIMIKLMKNEIPEISPNLPAHLVEIVQSCLKINPEERMSIQEIQQKIAEDIQIKNQLLNFKQKADYIIINIQTQRGNWTLKADTQHTIGRIKAEVQQNEGIAMFGYKLIFKGKKLCNKKILRYYNIRECDTLYLEQRSPLPCFLHIKSLTGRTTTLEADANE